MEYIDKATVNGSRHFAEMHSLFLYLQPTDYKRLLFCACDGREARRKELCVALQGCSLLEASRQVLLTLIRACSEALSLCGEDGVLADASFAETQDCAGLTSRCMELPSLETSHVRATVPNESL